MRVASNTCSSERVDALSTAGMSHPAVALVGTAGSGGDHRLAHLALTTEVPHLPGAGVGVVGGEGVEGAEPDTVGGVGGHVVVAVAHPVVLVVEAAHLATHVVEVLPPGRALRQVDPVGGRVGGLGPRSSRLGLVPEVDLLPAGPPELDAVAVGPGVPEVLHVTGLHVEPPDVVGAAHPGHHAGGGHRSRASTWRRGSPSPPPMLSTIGESRKTVCCSVMRKSCIITGAGRSRSTLCTSVPLASMTKYRM